MKQSQMPIRRSVFLTVTLALFVTTLLLFSPSCRKTLTGADEAKLEQRTGFPKPIKDEDTLSPTSPGGTLTGVAYISDLPSGQGKAIAFYNAQKIYKLHSSDPAYANTISQLGSAMSANYPVRVWLDHATGTIAKMVEATPMEVMIYTSQLTYESSLPCYISQDTVVLVDHADELRAPCTDAVPDLATLMQMFNFIKAQTCGATPAPTVTPCIPFKCAEDGCYARAHKMRQIIEEKFGYCSEKIFNYAEPGSQLAVEVKPGCCVYWWYHVAPVVKVNLNGRIVLMVIDPSMFNTPVSITTWRNAQTNANCTAHPVKQGTFEIVPSDKYTPGPIVGGCRRYGTDDNYTDTDQDLIDRKDCVTCP